MLYTCLVSGEGRFRLATHQTLRGANQVNHKLFTKMASMSGINGEHAAQRRRMQMRFGECQTVADGIWKWGNIKTRVGIAIVGRGGLGSRGWFKSCVFSENQLVLWPCGCSDGVVLKNAALYMKKWDNKVQFSTREVEFKGVLENPKV